MNFEGHIQTERLLLRPLRRRDLWFFFMLIGNQRVRRYLGGPAIWSQRLQRFKRYLAAPTDVGV